MGFGGRPATHSPLGIQADGNFLTVSVAASVLALGIEIHLAEGQKGRCMENHAQKALLFISYISHINLGQ